jgi:release factor glutamine methyltransferase
VIRGIATRAAALLRPGGALGIEHDDSHGEAVPALLRAVLASGSNGAGVGAQCPTTPRAFERIEDHPDLTGRPRFATGYRLPS